MLHSVFARGFTHRCTDGHQRFFVPTVAAYLGDIKEINDVMGIAPNSLYSDIGTLAPTHRLNEPDYEPPLRTESDVREVSLLQQHVARAVIILKLLQPTALFWS